MLIAFVVGNIFASVNPNLLDKTKTTSTSENDTIQIECPEDISTYTDINECSADISHNLNLLSPDSLLKKLTWKGLGT